MKYLATELSKVKVYTQIEHNLVKQDTINIKSSKIIVKLNV